MKWVRAEKTDRTLVGKRYSELSCQDVGSFRFGEFFDGVTKHRSGHLVVMLLDKQKEHWFVSLSKLSKHPSDGLVDQVMLMRKQYLCDFDCCFKIVAFDEIVSGHNRDSVLPEAF